MASSSSLFNSFKLKKVTRSSSKQDQTRAPDEDPWSSKTPEKPILPPRRGRNAAVALSVKEVKQMATAPRKPAPALHESAPAVAVASPPRLKKADPSMELPERYGMLAEFFNSLESSIRLLRMKGSMSTFTNIRPKIECLTDRRFSYGNLAQLKFILPEAIALKKILTHDERTSCMRPDLHVMLDVEGIEKLKLETGNSNLRKIFRARLLDFAQAHPEGDEIPEETLPDPFGRCKQDLHSTISKASNSLLPNETSTDTFTGQPLAVTSHLSQSFRRWFSQKDSGEAENSNKKSSNIPYQSSVIPLSDPCLNKSDTNVEAAATIASSSVECSSKPTAVKKCLAFGASPVCPPLSCPPATPVKKTDSTEDQGSSSMIIPKIQGTPAKLASTPAKLASTPAKLASTPVKLDSTPARLMTRTPLLQPPKRSLMNLDDDSINSPNKLVRRLVCSSSLKFDTPVKGVKTEEEVNEKGSSLVDNDIFDINLLQSIRENERKAKEKQDPAISQAKRRRKMIACLPKLFEKIHWLFHSINCSVITKEELMHKIIACDVDRGEVEEQLKLLQELAPEWISEKLVSNGDLLLWINKASNPELIRQRLMEAK